MPLVAYSDSEGSDSDSAPAPQAPPKTISGASFQRTNPRKIAVSLPTTKAEHNAEEPPPPKRARTGGGGGGINSFLPAPKRAAAGPKGGLGKGVNLKTSGEAAFSRNAAPVAPSFSEDSESTKPEQTEKSEGGVLGGGGEAASEAPKEEVKIVGKATRFMPLSVGNNKKRKVAKKAVPSEMSRAEGAAKKEESKPAAPAPVEKKKRSLFSVPQEEEKTQSDVSGSTYESLASQEMPQPPRSELPSHTVPTPASNIAPANSLASVADDLNLTPAQRRQFFGRQAGNKDVNITHFRTDAEYAANEELRQAGDAFEHRAVKSIAPGKHSLQQLVNNARQNEEAIEDKWAEGRAKRGGK